MSGVEEPDFTEDDFAAVDRAWDAIAEKPPLPPMPILLAVAKLLRIKPSAVARIKAILSSREDS